MSEEEAIKEIENYLDYEGSVSIQAIAILYTAYNKEKEKNKKIEDKIKKAIKEIERRMNLANECIKQEIEIADSNSLNYGRAQAHDVDSVLLKEILE